MKLTARYRENFEKWNQKQESLIAAHILGFEEPKRVLIGFDSEYTFQRSKVSFLFT